VIRYRHLRSYRRPLLMTRNQGMVAQGVTDYTLSLRERYVWSRLVFRGRRFCCLWGSRSARRTCDIPARRGADPCFAAREMSTRLRPVCQLLVCCILATTSVPHALGEMTFGDPLGGSVAAEEMSTRLRPVCQLLALCHRSGWGDGENITLGPCLAHPPNG
jgi:hypothetical protein